jgi:hypothetical protein
MNIDAVKEFFATSRDEAVSMASTHYGVAGGQLEVRELPATLGISGLGDRSCFLIWIAGEEHAAPRREARPGGPQGDRGDRGGDGRRRDRDRGRGGRGRGDRDRGREPRRERDGEQRRRDGRGEQQRGDRPEGVDEARLEAIAREAAERVQRSGEPEILESMSAKERWVVHNFLKTIAGVTSASEGEGASKRVKILPD